MSVFVSCLQVFFLICVCRYIHIYMYTRKTPWVYTDTLCAHRNTCIRVCVCMCVYVYTCIHICLKRQRVYIQIYICVCIYLHIHADFTCGCVDVWMYVCVYIHIYMVAEFTCVRVNVYITYMYTYPCWCVWVCRSVGMCVGVCLHTCTLGLQLCTPSLRVCVHIFTYIYACTYSHGVLMYDF